MKILISGFEPFAGDDINPSSELVSSLSDVPGLYTCILPVEFESCFEILKNRIDKVKPDYVISFGLNKQQSEVCVERVALNIIDANIPDNSGLQPLDKPVIEGLELALLSELPVKKFVSLYNELGVTSILSNSAGTYVCNYLMYKTISYCRGRGVRSGFIHVPLIKDISQLSKATQSVLGSLSMGD